MVNKVRNIVLVFAMAISLVFVVSCASVPSEGGGIFSEWATTGVGLPNDGSKSVGGGGDGGRSYSDYQNTINQNAVEASSFFNSPASASPSSPNVGSLAWVQKYARQDNSFGKLGSVPSIKSVSPQGISQKVGLFPAGEEPTLQGNYPGLVTGNEGH
jgi:hypothetical protein